jgi:hypothetical protein
MTERYKILLGHPHNGFITEGAARAMLRPSENHDVMVMPFGGSLLAAGFNYLLCQALNMYNEGKITHFAFIHADVAPEDGWLDILVDEMEEKKADFVSCVIAIKDGRGLTSTGVGQWGMEWSPKKRFTIKEVLSLPGTFSIEDTEYPDDILLHNSGLWVADLRTNVFNQYDSAGQALVYFTIRDKIEYVDGKYVHSVEPEDWYFSRRLYEQGARTFATRRVHVDHMGWAAYPNDQVWGQDVDEATRELWEPASADL